MIINYSIGSNIGRIKEKKNAKLLLSFGIFLNVSALGYYKYFDFFISNVNGLIHTDFPLLDIALPLGISFFTFQQIAYLVDAYRQDTEKYKFWKYALFVTFFPHLIAGPLVHHKDVMPQFSMKTKRINVENIAKGFIIFTIGLFKKAVIADTLAIWASAGFNAPDQLTFLEAWIASLSYTFQLYFDFSGYSDMAIGAALFFNIKLPINFNSPYKAVNIQDFWKRWHMTLTRFLTYYLYIPLGGNRKGTARTYVNIFIIFIVSGLWHGAGWTFVFWGGLHGVASIVNRLWQQLGFRMNKFLGWLITFLFVNSTWVFFRAKTWDDAIRMLTTMSGVNGFVLPDYVSRWMQSNDVVFTSDFHLVTMTNIPLEWMAFGLVIAFIVVLFFRNSIQLGEMFVPSWKWAVYVSLLFLLSIFSMSKVSEFLYFNF